jgi:hypothetical protein
MINSSEFKAGIEPTDKLRKSIEKIDLKLQTNPRLASKEFTEQWWKVRNSLRDLEAAYSSKGLAKDEFGKFRYNIISINKIIEAELSSLYHKFR